MDRSRARTAAAAVAVLVVGIAIGLGIGRITMVSKSKYDSTRSALVRERAKATAAIDQARAEALRAEQAAIAASHAAP